MNKIDTMRYMIHMCNMSNMTGIEIEIEIEIEIGWMDLINLIEMAQQIRQNSENMLRLGMWIERKEQIVLIGKNIG